MDIDNTAAIITAAFVAWHFLCGFSFAKSNSSRVPFGLKVVFWALLQPIDGLLKGDNND